jgi:hypothetical protein
VVAIGAASRAFPDQVRGVDVPVRRGHKVFEMHVAEGGANVEVLTLPSQVSMEMER